ncbi:hypothetical protein [Marinicella litoralis]|uniref:Uncharacterized protein n=1 Tax=Marinicella litoralis TaxID=644220 RepID=A0A4R6XPB2_9GAMM|nr:hypothetical protein [Marinicella litoralis]TDR19597.1 hypothetical protein C8D91_2154 [Marinicella litoralis]
MIKKLTLLLMILMFSLAQAKSPDLSVMTDEEKQLTGLNKLSAEELNALSDWIKNKQAEIDREIRQRNAGFEQRRQVSEKREIKARLEKTYNDKLGDTYYELDNGQIWKRISSGSIFIKKDGRHLVTIEPAMMGSWLLRGDGNKSVKVKRIK